MQTRLALRTLITLSDAESVALKIDPPSCSVYLERNEQRSECILFCEWRKLVLNKIQTARACGETTIHLRFGRMSQKFRSEDLLEFIALYEMCERIAADT